MYFFKKTHTQIKINPSAEDLLASLRCANAPLRISLTLNCCETSVCQLSFVSFPKGSLFVLIIEPSNLFHVGHAVGDAGLRKRLNLVTGKFFANRLRSVLLQSRS